LFCFSEGRDFRIAEQLQNNCRTNGVEIKVIEWPEIG